MRIGYRSAEKAPKETCNNIVDAHGKGAFYFWAVKTPLFSASEWMGKAMWKDPIVEEVRTIREKQAKAHGFDIKKIVADAKRKQKRSGHRIVSFPNTAALRKTCARP